MLIILSVLTFVYPHPGCSSVEQSTFRQIPPRCHVEKTWDLESEEGTSRSALTSLHLRQVNLSIPDFLHWRKGFRHLPCRWVGGRDKTTDGKALCYWRYTRYYPTTGSWDVFGKTQADSLLKRWNKWVTFSFASHPLLSKVVNHCQKM